MYYAAMTKSAATEPQITKLKVVMRTTVAVPVDDLFPNGTATVTATDYVRPDILDAYLATARTSWQSVEVDYDHPDAGPGGYHGQTVVPANIDHPLAGQTFAATTPEEN